jgi:hypothetical protein
MSSGLVLFAHKYRTAPRTRVGDWTDILTPIASVAHAGIEEAQADQKASASKADAAAKLAACLAADTASTQANAAACWSAVSHSPSAAADAAAANIATAAQDQAGALLPADQTPARAAAAKKALDGATASWQAATHAKGQAGAGYAKCLVDSAQATFNKASGMQIVSKTPDKPEESWLTKPLIFGVPTWEVGVGGVVAAAAWRLIRGKWGF